MSDLFHKDVPAKYIKQVFDIMTQAHWHTFQVLTKRAERLQKLSQDLSWAPNIWMGVTIEHEDYLYRKEHLANTGAQVKFLSLEPLLGPLPNLELSNIDWAIVGGESGPGARPIEEQWVKNIRDKCLAQNVPFFFKQWGGVWKKRTGRLLEGRTWDELPQPINQPQTA
jgi:protein gp37